MSDYTKTFYCVYLLREPSPSQYHKIGRTNNLGRRLTELHAGRPFPLELLDILVVPSAEDAAMAEECLHKQLRDCHVNGEWFRLRSMEQWRAAVARMPVTVLASPHTAQNWLWRERRKKTPRNMASQARPSAREDEDAREVAANPLAVVPRYVKGFGYYSRRIRMSRIPPHA